MTIKCLLPGLGRTVMPFCPTRFLLYSLSTFYLFPIYLLSKDQLEVSGAPSPRTCQSVMRERASPYPSSSIRISPHHWSSPEFHPLIESHVGWTQSCESVRPWQSSPQDLPRSSLPGSLASEPGWASCPSSSRPATERSWVASASAATVISARCSSKAPEPYC